MMLSFMKSDTVNTGSRNNYNKMEAQAQVALLTIISNYENG